MTELEPIIQELSSSDTEVLICGEYNMNLLKLIGEAHFSDFFEWCLVIVFTLKLHFPHD